MKIYDILGVKPDASIDEIRVAYQNKLKQIDMSKNIKEYQDLREAYNLALKQIRTNETLSINIEAIPITAKNSELDTNKSIVSQPDTVTKPEIIPEEPKIINSTWHQSFEHFLSQKNFYTSYADWEKLLKPFIQSSDNMLIIKKDIKSFLITNYMLLEDCLRFKLLKLVGLTDKDFTTSKEITIYKENIKPKNNLDLSFYSYIPKDNRNNYFKDRYLFYLVIQKNKPIDSLGINTINQLKKSDYGDSDLNYLLIVYGLIYPNFLPTKEIKDKVESVQKEMYLHDLEVFRKFVALIENHQAPMVSNIEIIGLSWVADDIKELLMSSLKDIRRTIPKENKITRKTKSYSPVYQPENNNVLKKRFFIFLALFLGMVGVISVLSSDNEFSYDYDEVFEDEEDTFDNSYDEVAYKQEMRTSNVKINYNIYSLFLYDQSIDTEFMSVSKNALKELSQLRNKHLETIDNLEIYDVYTDINETHYLTADDTIITYSDFKDGSLFFKSITNNFNEVTSFQEITKEELPVNSNLGTLDASLFFTNDLISNYEDLENYLSDLEELYDLYLTNELYEQLVQIDEEQFSFLSSFAYAKPYLLKIPNKNVIALTNYDEDSLFLELDNDYKIQSIYFDFFNDIPEEYLQALETISEEIDLQTDNPWAYDLGIAW